MAREQKIPKFTCATVTSRHGTEVACLKRPWWKQPIAYLAALGIVIVLIGYGRTLEHPMVFDDRVYLKHNPLVKESRSFAYPVRFVEFANEARGRLLDPDLSANFILRPVSYLSFHVNYIFGGMNPAGYRAVNILIHLANGLLIYALARGLLGGTSHGSGQPPSGTGFIAATASLLYLAHPLATESVTYIVQRFTSLAAFFYLGTLVLHLESFRRQSAFEQRTFRLLAFAACLLGMLSKECVFTAPVMAVLVDWLVHRTPLRLSLKKAWPLLALMPLVPTLVVLTAWAQHQGSLTLKDVIHLANIKDVDNSQLSYLITQITILPHYLRLILWPSGQTVDPEWPHYDSLLQAPVAAALMLQLALLAVSGWWYHRSKQDVRVRLAFTGVLWFFITILPSSSLFPLPDMVAEHRSLLPSVGILLTVAAGLDWLRRTVLARIDCGWLVPMGAGLFVIGLTIATMERNEIWSSRLRLWQDAVSKSPGKPRAWGNLGAAYSGERQLPEAIFCFEKALELDPHYFTAYKDLGTLHYLRGDARAVLRICERARDADPRFGGQLSICFNTAIAHLALGHLRRGEALLTEISRVAPAHRETQVALAHLYKNLRKPDLARRHLLSAAALHQLSNEETALLESLR